MKALSSCKKLHAAFETFFSHHEIEHGRPAGTIGRDRASERGLDVMRIGDALAVTAGRPGEPCEIEIERELGCDVASVEGVSLGVPDRAERAIIEDAPGHAEIEFGSNRQNVHYHLKRTVTDQANRRTIRIDEASDRKRGS